MDFKHTPVLLKQCIEGLNIKPDGIYCDGTAGGGGHSVEIAGRLDGSLGGRLVAIDRDPQAVEAAKKRLEGFPAQVVRGNFSQVDQVAQQLGILKFDGVLLDLGVSSHQLDDVQRGFSYQGDASLDMRMSMSGISAKDVVNGYDYKRLEKVIYEYGEERYAPYIAGKIVKAREQKPIETTLELAQIIKSSIPAKARRGKNPCKKTFQAIRIEVNDELGEISQGLEKIFNMLNTGGRFCVITFHSLEDRLVKQSFQEFCRGCICPPDFPVCVCHRTPKGRLVNKKPIVAQEDELAHNNRSRSAKLRIIEKI